MRFSIKKLIFDEEPRKYINAISLSHLKFSCSLNSQNILIKINISTHWDFFNEIPPIDLEGYFYLGKFFRFYGVFIIYRWNFSLFYVSLRKIVNYVFFCLKNAFFLEKT